MSENFSTVVVTPESCKVERLSRPLVIPEAQQIEIETGQKFGVCVIDARNGDEYKKVGDTYVVALGFNGSVEKFIIQQHAVMAQELGARLIVVDTPGFGELSSQLSIEQASDLIRHGDYSSCAKAMLQAAIKAGELQEGEEIGLIGYSQGASMIAAMASVLNTEHDDLAKLQLHGLHMIEPVADHKQSSVGLFVRLGKENVRNDGYLGENNELLDSDGIPWAVSPIDRRVDTDPSAKAWLKSLDFALQQPGLMLGGLALGRGRIGLDLNGALLGNNDTTRLGEGTITSTLPDKSGMTDVRRQTALLTDLNRLFRLGRVGVISRMGEGHTSVLSFQRAGSMAQIIGEQN